MKVRKREGGYYLSSLQQSGRSIRTMLMVAKTKFDTNDVKLVGSRNEDGDMGARETSSVSGKEIHSRKYLTPNFVFLTINIVPMESRSERGE